MALVSATKLSEGYAKAILLHRNIKDAVQNFSQIQHNIIRNLTNIIRVEIVFWLLLYWYGRAEGKKKALSALSVENADRCLE